VTDVVKMQKGQKASFMMQVHMKEVHHIFHQFVTTIIAK